MYKRIILRQLTPSHARGLIDAGGHTICMAMQMHIYSHVRAVKFARTGSENIFIQVIISLCTVTNREAKKRTLPAELGRNHTKQNTSSNSRPLICADCNLNIAI